MDFLSPSEPVVCVVVQVLAELVRLIALVMKKGLVAVALAGVIVLRKLHAVIMKLNPVIIVGGVFASVDLSLK